ncbi:hypothetical protein PInf_005818 [Phytophthora infestans]|nr:hypothetical protein PInf_005818 [Phytophthora infestans]
MAQSVKALLAYDRRKQNEYQYRIELIVYRKFKGIAGPIILWNRIDERWTTSSQQLKKVKQFAYEKFMSGASESPRKKLRTQSERYREAVRTTHLIANEMADIEDEEEFDEMLKFVLAQWRNIRQRTMATMPLETYEETPCITKEDYSREGKDYDALAKKAKKEFNISTSEGEKSSSDDQSEAQSSTCSAKQATSAKKVGRTAKLKQKTAADEKKDRKRYESNKAARQQAGEVMLLGLVDSLDREKPGLNETQRRLSGIIVKHGESEKKKPKVKLMKNPVLTLDPFYLLPPKLLDVCIKVLPVSNTKDTAIALEGSQASQQSVASSDKASIETVIIKDMGNFSRKQIETFKRVQNLKDLVTIGLGAIKWIVNVALPTLPAEYHALTQQVNFARRQTVACNSNKLSDALRESKGNGTVSVRLADGKVVTVPNVQVDLAVKFENFDSLEQFTVLDMNPYDMILGMPWFEKHEP